MQDYINFYTDKYIYLNFHPLEAVSLYRDPQLQVGENYSYLFSLRPNICKAWFLNKHFNPQYQWFDRQIKRIKKDNSRA